MLYIFILKNIFTLFSPAEQLALVKYTLAMKLVLYLSIQLFHVLWDWIFLLLTEYISRWKESVSIGMAMMVLEDWAV